MKRGLLSEKMFMEVTQLLNIPNIPIKLHEMHFDQKILLESIKNDKKHTGKDLTMIIPDGDFKLKKVSDVTELEFNETLDYVKRLLF